jgi:aspartyl protease family protein
MMGNKALLMVNGGPPKSVAPGETHQGVKVISTTSDQAVVEQSGKRHTLRIGDAPMSVRRQSPHAGRTGQPHHHHGESGGHFMTARPDQRQDAVQFMVDTGATAVSMSVADAERMGIDYKDGRPVQHDHGQRHHRIGLADHAQRRSASVMWKCLTCRPWWPA